MYQPVNSNQPQPTAKNPGVVSQEADYSDPPSGITIARDAASTKTSAKKPRRLSFLIKFSIVASLLFLAGAVAFVSWLWWAPRDDARWRQWALAPNRVQLSITLAGVIIRTAVGILAAIATTMVASVAVERGGVHLHAIAQVSVARFSGGGPFSLGYLLLRGSSLEGLVRLMVALLVLTTIAAQFTSTLLVSDLEERRIVSFPRTRSNAYTFVRHPPWKGVLPEAISGYAHNYWFQRPRLTETFAEYSEPPAEGEGIDDTGPTVRAFLPISSQEARESLLEFRGMSRVIDSRVVCMRPELSDLKPCQSRGANAQPFDINLCGSIKVDGSVAAADAGLEWPENKKFDFNCPITSYGNPYTWQLCAYQTMNWTSFQSPLSNTTTLTTTRLVWDAGRLVNSLTSGSVNGTVTKLNSSSSGPWTQEALRVKYKENNNPERTEDISFKMTMCTQFAVFPDSIQYLNISASSTSNRTEPTYTWNVDDEIYDTSAVRHQLGAVRDGSSLSHQDRQVLSISRESLASSAAEARQGTAWQQYHADPALTWFYDRVTYFRQPSMPIAFCPVCASDTDADVATGTADIIYTRLFADTMNQTGSPALALQAVHFTLARLVYYDYISSFAPNTAAPGADVAHVVTFEPTSIPWHIRGYLAVVGILVVFLVTFAATVALFLPTRFSLPDNAWHTIAQISGSRELRDVLHEARMATDDDVETFIRSSRGAFDGSKSALTSGFSFSSGRKTPRFVVRDGVFTRVSDRDGDVELQDNNQSRHRLTRRGSASGRESLD